MLNSDLWNFPHQKNVYFFVSCQPITEIIAMLALYYVFSFDLNKKSHRKSNYNPQIYSCAVIQCMIIWCYACCRSWVLVVPLRCAETWIWLGWELLLVVMNISGCGWCHYWRCEELLLVPFAEFGVRAVN